MTTLAEHEAHSSSYERKSSNATIDTESLEHEQKEGDLSSWLTVLGSVLIYYSSFGILNSFGFFLNYYTKTFLKSTPTAHIAFIGTLQMALMNSLAAVSGPLCDRHGVKVTHPPSSRPCHPLTSYTVSIHRLRQRNDHRATHALVYPSWTILADFPCTRAVDGEFDSVWDSACAYDCGAAL